MPVRSPPPISNVTVMRWSIIVVAVVAAALLLWQLRGLLLMVFAAVLVAIIFRSAADWLAARARIPPGGALVLVLLALCGGIAASAYLFGTELSTQFSELVANLPAAWAMFERTLGQLAFGRELLAQIEQAAPDGTAIMATVQTVVTTLGSILSGFVLVLVAGIYLAAQPHYYRHGLLKLVPARHRDHWRETLRVTGRAIRLWLIGQLVAMIGVGLLTGIGLWLLGVPAPFALAILAALAEFIPFAGPILAAVPGLLFASTQGIDTFLWAAALYLVVQQVEGNLLTPLIQRHAVDLPPALTVFALVAMGGLFGVGGLLLAAPLTVVAFVATKKLYVRDVLHEATPLPGEPDDHAVAR